MANRKFDRVSKLAYHVSGELVTKSSTLKVEDVIEYLKNDDSILSEDFTLRISKLHHGYPDVFILVIKQGDSLELHGEEKIYDEFVLGGAWYYISSVGASSDKKRSVCFKNY
jgi:hypothetical protein